MSGWYSLLTPFGGRFVSFVSPSSGMWFFLWFFSRQKIQVHSFGGFGVSPLKPTFVVKHLSNLELKTWDVDEAEGPTRKRKGGPLYRKHTMWWREVSSQTILIENDDLPDPFCVGWGIFKRKSWAQNLPQSPLKTQSSEGWFVLIRWGNLKVRFGGLMGSIFVGKKLCGTVDGSEILHPPVEVGSLSHYLQGILHPRWLAGFLPSTGLVKYHNPTCWRLRFTPIFS